MRRIATSFLIVIAASCFAGPWDPSAFAERAAAGGAPRVVASATVARDEAVITTPASQAGHVQEKRIRAARLPWLAATSGDGPPAGFYARQPRGATWVADDEVRYEVASADSGAASWVIRERFLDGRSSSVEPGTPARAIVSEFLGNDPSKWRSGLPTWSSVHLRQIYDGVDVEFRLTSDMVEKVLTVQPGGSVAQVRIGVEGVDELARLEDGTLELRSEHGRVQLSAPVAWQGEGEGRRDISVSYRVEGLTYGFEVGDYDRTRALLIDPVLYSTFVGGNATDQLFAIAIGPDGYIYVTGLTQAGATVPYPTTAGAYDRTLDTNNEIVVSKFAPDLGTLVASTYVGGNGTDVGRKIAFDASGNVFVAGETFSSNFPTLGASSWESTLVGGGYSGVEAFILKLNASLTSLLGSTYLGGYWYTGATALAVNPSDGSVFVAGVDDTSDRASWVPSSPAGRVLPTTGYLKDPITTSLYAFIARLNNSLSNMTALTYLYGPRTCSVEGSKTYCPRGGAYEIADLGVANGSLYGVGRTSDWTFPTTAGAYDRSYSTGTTFASKSDDVADVLLVKFDLGLTTLQASTFLGGRYEDYGKGLAFDGKGNVFVTGVTRGTLYVGPANDPELFPVTPGAFDVTHNAGLDAFVSRLDPALTSLQASTFLGGEGRYDEWVADIAVAPGVTGAPGEGDVFIGGTADGQIPTGVRAFQDTAAWENYGAGWYHTNPYIVRFDWKLQRVVAATYLQSPGNGEEILGIAVTSASPRDVYVAGYAGRVDFPVSAGAYDTSYNGGSDGFVSRLPATLAQPGILVNVRGPAGISPGQRGTFTVNYANGLDIIASNVVIAAAVPAGMNLVDIGDGGAFYTGGRNCAGEVMWRFPSLNPGDGGSLTFTVEVPWGAPDATVEITARGAAANEATPYFDVAPYLAFVPEPHPASVELDANGLAAQWSAFPAARRLLDYATSIGYRFFGTASLDTVPDATKMLRLHLFAPDGGLATLAATGERAFIDRFVGDTYVLMGADGGFTWDRTAGTLTPFGGWATTTQPSGPLTLALGDESDQAVWAMAATGLQVARCRFNCMLNSIPEVALSKLSSTYKTISAAKNCTVCALSIGSGTPNNEACLKCSAAMAKQLEAAKDLAPVIGDALKAYYIIGNCEADCAKNPNKHICTQDRWECCWTILSWLGGFDAKCRTACNRTTGTYAPVITDRVNCAYGETCVDGACGGKPACKGVSCDTRQTRTRVARDPNAKAVSPGGVVLQADTLTYTVDYENVGAGAAEGVFILDTLDTDLDASTLVLDPRCSYTAATRLIACTIGTLAASGQAGAKGSVSFTVRPEGGLPTGTEIVNQAEVHFPSAFEITPTNAVVNRIGGVRAEPRSLVTNVGTPVAVALAGADAGGAAVSFRLTRAPLNGTLTGSGASRVYTPDANFSGGDDFEYVASNGQVESAPAVVTVTVSPSAASDTTRPTVLATSPANGASGVPATTLDVSGTKVYGPTVEATLSEAMDPATLTTSTFTVSGLSGQVAYNGITRTVSFVPSVAVAAGTTYTATVTTGAKDASGNALAGAYTWTFKTLGASEPNITAALPDAGTSPVLIGIGLGNRRKTVSFSNIGNANLRITGTALTGGDDSAFLIEADGCLNQTLVPGGSCSLAVVLGASASPTRTTTLRVTSNDPDSPTVDVALRSTTASSPAPHSYYLAEGATIPLFRTVLAVANPGATAATGLMRFLLSDGSVVPYDFTIGPHTRLTLDVGADVPGMADVEFATTVESDQPLAVERTMTWDRTLTYGAHAERSAAGPSPVWYLAEGATHSGFDLFYLLQNPNAAPIDVKVRYLLPGGQAPIETTYTVPANARKNIWVDNEELPAGSGAYPFVATDVSAVLTSVGGEGFIVERAMYLSNQGRLFNAGHESAGVTAPARTWFLAEGATGDFFDLFVLVANPNASSTQVKATYLLEDGTTYEKTYEVAGNSRFNIWVDMEEVPAGSGQFPLAQAAVSTTVESLDPAVPIIVERAMWWPGSAAGWYEAHNSPGSTAVGTRWVLADGEASADVDTYVLVANTSAFAGQVRVTLLYEDGTTSAPLLVDLAPRSRKNVVPEFEIAGAANRKWAVVVESVDTGGGLPQVVVERAMYWNAGRVMFAAGSNLLGTRLQ
jgi:hypothetical protein